MPDDPTDTTTDRDDSSRVAPAVDGDYPDVTCTLTTEQAERRRAWMEEALFPHLEAIEERDDGFSFVFDRSAEAYEAVAEVAWKESQCCAWATFEVELPPGEEPIRWHERSDRDAGTALFGDALREIRREFEGVPEVD